MRHFPFPLGLLLVILGLASGCGGGGGGGDNNENGPGPEQLLAIATMPTVETDLFTSPATAEMVLLGRSGTAIPIGAISDGFVGQLPVPTPGAPAFEEFADFLTDGANGLVQLLFRDGAVSRGESELEDRILQLEVPARGAGGDLAGYQITDMAIVVDRAEVGVVDTRLHVLVEVRLLVFGRPR